MLLTTILFLILFTNFESKYTNINTLKSLD